MYTIYMPYNNKLIDWLIDWMRYDELYLHALKSWRKRGTAPKNKEH